MYAVIDNNVDGVDMFLKHMRAKENDESVARAYDTALKFSTEYELHGPLKCFHRESLRRFTISLSDANILSSSSSSSSSSSNKSCFDRIRQYRPNFFYRLCDSLNIESLT